MSWSLKKFSELVSSESPCFFSHPKSPGDFMNSAPFFLPSMPPPLARREMEYFLSWVGQCDRIELYKNPATPLPLRQVKCLFALLKKRREGWPMAYLLKEKDFYGHTFKVTKGVFIPRPETETLVSSALQALASQQGSGKSQWIMDLGSGTGAVGLSLLKALNKAYLFGVDFNEKAFQLSQQNAKKLKLSHRAFFFHQDILKWDTKCPIFKYLKEKIDIVVANPPYIAFDDSRVEKQVLSFEPAGALFSGEGGLQHIRAFLNKAFYFLKPGGFYLFEIGAGQEKSFLSLKIPHLGFQKTAEFKDLSGITRVIQLKKRF